MVDVEAETIALNEPTDIRILAARARLSRRPTLIDIGANNGAYTLMATMVPDMQVIAIEPVPYTYFLLRCYPQQLLQLRPR